jgi:hypothetical protein
MLILNIPWDCVERLQMIIWRYGYVMTSSTSGIMGLLTFLTAVALVVMDHVLEYTLARNYG